MTQPGTLGNAIPRGNDWVPREFAAIWRAIRRLGANTAAAPSGGGPVAAGAWSSSDPAGWAGATLDIDQFGNAADFWSFDGIINWSFLAIGWYQVSAWISLTGVTTGDQGYIEIDSPSPESFVDYPLTPGLSGNSFGHASTLPFYIDSSSGYSVNPTVHIVSGTALSSGIYLVKLA